MRVDLKVSPQFTTWGTLRDLCVQADQTGHFTGLWLYDHLGPVSSGGGGDNPEGGCFEGWSTLAALAEATTRLRLGLLVSPVTFRNVGLFGQIVSTVDHISGGRVEVGLGAGNNAAETEAFGLPFGHPGERTQHLEEYVLALRSLLDSNGETSLDGRHVHVRTATLRPPPVQSNVPILVGGKGERRTLRTAARFASGWNYSVGSPEEFRRKWDVLLEHATEAGREIRGFRRSVQVRVPQNDPRSAVKLARKYIDAGATDIAFYINATPAQFDTACAAAVELMETA